mmetsp:Transcript_59029/g.109084  ORF Transcript_59029/g.109084 Transcript_59029/m.109084 type:complete len:455 (+) Transcript_59029:80-1444(+)
MAAAFSGYLGEAHRAAKRWADMSDDEQDLKATSRESNSSHSHASTLTTAVPATRRRCWADMMSDEEDVPESPRSACSTMAPPSECGDELPAAVGLGDDSEGEDAKEEVVVEAPRRPQFAQVTKEQRLLQIRRTLDEFLQLSFDQVEAEQQGGLVHRMLATLKSLASVDVYWADAKRGEVDRYVLLGLEEDDMYAIGDIVKRADKLSEKRSYRKAFEVLEKAKPWLQGGDLSDLRQEWQATKAKKQLKKESAKTKEKASTNQAEEDDWMVVPSRKAPVVPPAKQERTSYSSIAAAQSKRPAPGASASSSSTSRPHHAPAPRLNTATSAATAAARGNTQCQFYIGIEATSDFQPVRKVLGPHGCNMKRIAEETGSKLRLRGKGSGFKEGPHLMESSDPLMLCVSAPDPSAYLKAKELVTELLEDVYHQYRTHCRRVGKGSGDVRVQVHEGYREGSR